ncbi:MAG: DUF1836 domain-containing protein [Pygmaiobacter sp.]
MKEIETLIRRLHEERPAPFSALPDIDLYKDQVLTYMLRQQPLGDPAPELTGAMINNYIKSGLLPRPQGKRYSKQHLAYLTAICQLKQILSVAEMDRLLKNQPDLAEPSAFYTRYCAALDGALNHVAAQVATDLSRETVAQQVLELCLASYASRLAALQLLALLEDQ